MIVKCNKCQHEWEVVKVTEKTLTCDWCKAKGSIIGKCWYDKFPFTTNDILRKLKEKFNGKDS